MYNIRPVSDLRNKYTEIEDTVLKEGEPVILTKNGYGSMVVMSLEQYAEMTDEIELIDKYEELKGELKITKTIDGENITEDDLENLTFTVKTPDGQYFDKDGNKVSKDRIVFLMFVFK